MRLLLISNSTNAGEAYLDYPKHEIKDFLGKEKVKALFFPYAGVAFSYDEYEEKVKSRFQEIGHDIGSIHNAENPIQAIREAEAIVIGGGNTFHLLKMIRDLGLIEPVRDKVLSGTPYIGWSAGANLACPTIKTTNDMPIIEPDSFEAFHFVNFQINPHYLDKNPDGHAGETREDRIGEFLAVNQHIKVFGLREGCIFKIESRQMNLIGNNTSRLFEYGKEPRELSSEDDFSPFIS